MKNIKNEETVLLTGASSGIGYELGKLFAKDGYNMVLVSRDRQKLETAADSFRKEGAGHITVISKDLFKAESAKEIYDEVKQRGIFVDVLVNDAGMGEYGNFINTSLEKELDIIQLNICSLVSMTKFFLKDMVAADKGKILQLASVSSYQPTPKLAVYGGTKAFVLYFTDAIAFELKDTNVTVTALIPGPTDTDFFNKAGMEDTKAAQDNPEDPAVAAEIGYKALMDGENHGVAPGMTKQIIMSSMMPNQSVAKQASKLMKKVDHPEEIDNDERPSIH